jgi:hypothetical protein
VIHPQQWDREPDEKPESLVLLVLVLGGLVLAFIVVTMLLGSTDAHAIAGQSWT